MRFLLDTNVVSAAMEPSPSQRILRQLSLHEGHMAMASTTWHELRFGVERLSMGRRKEDLAALLAKIRDHLSVLDYDAACAEWHARERARLIAAGRMPQLADGQIAAVAATRGLTLVTANVKDFRRYNGLDVVDWSR